MLISFVAIPKHVLFSVACPGLGRSEGGENIELMIFGGGVWCARGASSFYRRVPPNVLVLRGSKANRQRRDTGVSPRSVFFSEGDYSFSAGMRLRVFS